MFIAIPIVIDNMAFSSIVEYCGGTIDWETFTLKIIRIKIFVVLIFHSSFDSQSIFNS